MKPQRLCTFAAFVFIGGLSVLPCIAQPAIREAESRFPISSDPAVNPSKPKVDLPGSALVDRLTDEGSFEEDDDKQVRWEHTTWKFLARLSKKFP